MHVSLKTVLLTILFLSALPSGTPLTGTVAQAQISSPYGEYDFTMTTMDGKQVTLSDYQGKVVLVNYWATWCTSCVTKIPALVRLYNQYQNRGFVVLGVSTGGNENLVNEFIQKCSIPYPVGRDSTDAVGNSYGIDDEFTSFLFSPQGELKQRFQGFSATTEETLNHEILALLDTTFIPPTQKPETELPDQIKQALQELRNFADQKPETEMAEEGDTSNWEEAEQLADQLSREMNQLAQQGYYAKAARLGERVVRIQEKVLGPPNPGTANALSNLAKLCVAMKNYSKALLFYQQVVTIREKALGKQHPYTAGALVLLADVYSRLGDASHAVKTLQQALIRLERYKDDIQGFDSTAAHIRLANFRMKFMGDTEGASERCQTAARFLLNSKIFGSEQESSFSSLVGDSASITMDSPLSSFDMVEFLDTRFPRDKSSLNQRIEHNVFSVEQLEKSHGPNHPVLAKLFNQLAIKYWVVQNYEKALYYFERGLAAQDRSFARVFVSATEDEKLLFAEQSQESYMIALSLIAQHFSTDASAIRLGLEFVLRRKGIVLDTQTREQRILAENSGNEVLAAWQRLTQNRSTLSHLLLSGPGKQSPTEYEQAVDKLRAAITQEEEFLAQHNGLAAQELSQQEVTAQRLAEALPREGTLVEFVRIQDWDEENRRWATADRYIAFTLTADNQVTLINLGEAETIDTKLSESLAAIENPEFRRDLQTYAHQVDTQLAQLYALLLHPLEAALGSRKKLIVSPDGELSKVPFAALRTPDGYYLIEKTTVSYVSSGRDLLQTGREGAATVDLLLVANPAFDDQEILQATAVSESAVRASDYGEHFDPLPGTAAEAHVIPSLLTGTQQVLQGREATESAVRSAKSPKVLHLATHGFFLKNEDTFPPDARISSSLLVNNVERGKGGIKVLSSGKPSVTQQHVNPLVRSGLALAGANHAKDIKTGDDGILTALEVTGMNLYGTDLVVLSACETGLGDVQVGEGVYGLRRAFVLAGAKNLVMSLWAANDKITLEQMKAFYQGYGSGKTPAVALREAQLQTIASLREQTKASIGEPLAPVKLWAPFIVQQTAEGNIGSSSVSVRTGTYQKWNFIVPLLAMFGLLILSRVRLSSLPTETEGTLLTIPKQGSPPPTPIAASRPVPYARFVCQTVSNVLPQEVALIHDDMVLGSGTGCDVILRHPSIATQHARIQWRKQGYILIDLQSSTGTYVNGRRITENLLKGGWRVRLGEIEFVFYEATTHV